MRSGIWRPILWFFELRCIDFNLAKNTNMNTKKIIPSFWFNSKDGDISIVVKSYQTVFHKIFKGGQIKPLGKTPRGKRKCEIESSWRIVFVNKQRKGAGSCS